MYNGDRSRKCWSTMVSVYRLPWITVHSSGGVWRPCPSDCLCVCDTGWLQKSNKRYYHQARSFVKQVFLVPGGVIDHGANGWSLGWDQCACRTGRADLCHHPDKKIEDLTDYFKEMGVKGSNKNTSDIKTLGWNHRDLRQIVFDVLVGIDLLREGIDVPEVSLVAFCKCGLRFPPQWTPDWSDHQACSVTVVTWLCMRTPWPVNRAYDAMKRPAVSRFNGL